MEHSESVVMGWRKELWSSEDVSPDNAYAKCEQEDPCSGNRGYEPRMEDMDSRTEYSDYDEHRKFRE